MVPGQLQQQCSLEDGDVSVSVGVWEDVSVSVDVLEDDTRSRIRHRDHQRYEGDVH